MINDFNLVISTYRGRENDCVSELWYFLKDLGDSKTEFSFTGLPGLLVAKTCLDPFSVVEEIRSEAYKQPWYFRYLLKIVPIQVTVKTDINIIKENALTLANENINKEESYKILIRKRLTEMKAEDLISVIAPNISNKVSLEKPDKIILIEIIGNITGISVIRPEHIVSIQRIKRERRGI